MGQSTSQESVGPTLITSDTQEEFPEPQTFLEKSVYGSFILSVLWTSHIRFPLNGLVVPVYSNTEEIRVMNHFLMRGVSIDMIEDLLEKSSFYPLLNVGEFKSKEYAMEKERKSPVTVLFVKYPRYTGKQSEIEELKKAFEGLLEEAKRKQLFRFVIPIVQPATIMTFPKAIFCATLVEVALRKMKKWAEDSLTDDGELESQKSFKMKLILLASENSGCRLMCKHLVEQCQRVAKEEGEDGDEEKATFDPNSMKLSQISSIEVLESEIDGLDVTKIKHMRVNHPNERKKKQDPIKGVTMHPANDGHHSVNPQPNNA